MAFNLIGSGVGVEYVFAASIFVEVGGFVRTTLQIRPPETPTFSDMGHLYPSADVG